MKLPESFSDVFLKATAKLSEDKILDNVDVLHNLYNFSSNDFVKQTTVMHVYSVLRNKSIKFDKLLSCSEISSLCLSFPSFEEYYLSTFSKNLTTFRDSVSAVSGNLRNVNDLIAFSIIEAAIAFSNTKYKFLSTDFSNEHKFISSNVFKLNKKVKDETECILLLQDKPDGFYCVDSFYDKYDKSIRGVRTFIVSKQGNDLCYIYLPEKSKFITGLNSSLYHRYSNIVTHHYDSSDFILDFDDKNVDKEKSNSLAKKESFEYQFCDSLKFINSVIVYIFVSMFKEKYQSIIKENKSFVALENKFDKKFPVVFENVAFPKITFEDIRFDGNISYLSYLDDMFKDVINMDLVNFDLDSIDPKYVNKRVDVSVENNERYTILFPSYIKEMKKENFKLIPYEFYKKTTKKGKGCFTDMIELLPINKNYIGTKEEIFKYAKTIALKNKIKLYAIYLKHYLELNQLNYFIDKNEYFEKNIVNILKDDEFLSLVKEVSYTKSLAPRHLSSLTLINGGHVNVFPCTEKNPSLYHSDNYGFVKTVLFDDGSVFELEAFEDFKFKQLFNFNIEKTKDVFTHKEAHFLFELQCNNTDMLHYLQEKHGFNIKSDPNNVMFKLYEIGEKAFVDLKINSEALDHYEKDALNLILDFPLNPFLIVFGVSKSNFEKLSCKFNEKLINLVKIGFYTYTDFRNFQFKNYKFVL